jgi:hypothetical protein
MILKTLLSVFFLLLNQNASLAVPPPEQKTDQLLSSETKPLFHDIENRWGKADENLKTEELKDTCFFSENTHDQDNPNESLLQKTPLLKELRQLLPKNLNETSEEISSEDLLEITVDLLENISFIEEKNQNLINVKKINETKSFLKSILLKKNKKQLVKKKQLSNFKKNQLGAFIIISMICAETFYLTQDPWIKSSLLMMSAALLSAGATLSGQFTSPPENWSTLSKMLTKSVVCSAIKVPGNILFFLSFNTKTSPDSLVGPVALNSLAAFFYYLFFVNGELFFFDQPSNWPTWFGVGLAGLSAGVQIWHASAFPEEYSSNQH